MKDRQGIYKNINSNSPEMLNPVESLVRCDVHPCIEFCLLLLLCDNSNRYVDMCVNKRERERER